MVFHLPGHPLSSNLCSISAKSAWDCASKMLHEACIRDNGNPVVGSPEYMQISSQFRDSNVDRRNYI